MLAIRKGPERHGFLPFLVWWRQMSNCPCRLAYRISNIGVLAHVEGASRNIPKNGWITVAGYCELQAEQFIFM